MTQEVLLGLFIYDPDTGSLRWRDRPQSSFADLRGYRTWLSRFKGKEAGSKQLAHGTSRRKEIQVRFNGRLVAAHRIAWIMTYGSIPDGFMIDHENRDPWDNRLSNLRLATAQQNQRNSPRRNAKFTSLKGVTRDKQSGRYIAQIRINRKRTYLGRFDTEAEAHEAFLNAAIKAGYGDFLHV